jgi:hypothetical protein
MDHNAELKEFLRSRRARLRVDGLDLDDTGRVRRVPGLRREEVARLAGAKMQIPTLGPSRGERPFTRAWWRKPGGTSAQGMTGIRPTSGVLAVAGST